MTADMAALLAEYGPKRADPMSAPVDHQPGDVPRLTNRELSFALQVARTADQLQPGHVLQDHDVELIQAMGSALRGHLVRALACRPEPGETHDSRGGTGAWRYEARMDDLHHLAVRHLAEMAAAS